MKITTTKRIVWVCLINGICWVWCSYLVTVKRSQKASLHNFGRPAD